MCFVLGTALVAVALLHPAEASLRRHRSHGPFLVKEPPGSPAAMKELAQMRSSGRLASEDEAAIDKATTLATRRLGVPKAVLWCLMFQESRLNHLLGIDATSGATGIGQFLFPSFYEVNFQSARYSARNIDFLVDAIGYDARPIGAFRREPAHPSSYYSIPTGVAATAVYLHNRYLQLEWTLKRKGLAFNPDLLWLYAALAYNKGNRSVLNLWSEVRQQRGQRALERLLSEPDSFFELAADHDLLESALGRVWEGGIATEFSHEWRVHGRKIAECATGGSSRALMRRIASDGVE
jgi:hypothetical protein